MTVVVRLKTNHVTLQDFVKALAPELRTTAKLIEATVEITQFEDARKPPLRIEPWLA